VIGPLSEKGRANKRQAVSNQQTHGWLPGNRSIKPFFEKIGR